MMDIGVSAMLQSVISYILLKAPYWDRQEAVRWLTGGRSWAEVLPTLAALISFGGLLRSRTCDFESLRLGDDAAAALAVVAPGIAGTLLASALGLVAAIPAIVVYTVFARSITGYRAVLADAAAGVERLVSRDLDYRTVLVPCALRMPGLNRGDPQPPRFASVDTTEAPRGGGAR